MNKKLQKIKRKIFGNKEQELVLSPSEIKLEYLRKQLARYPSEVFVDLGSGQDAFAANNVSGLINYGICVDIIDSVELQYRNLSYVKAEIGIRIPLADESVDALWASHILEHVCNLGDFLLEIRRVLKPNGLFMVAVPPFKYEIVNHFTTGWTTGQLGYIMAAFGFDCSLCDFCQKGYNVFGAGFKKELLVNETTHFGYNGISIQSVLQYLPNAIKKELDRYNMAETPVFRFDGRIANAADKNYPSS